jgi:flagellar basal body-associated protein FliL
MKKFLIVVLVIVLLVVAGIAYVVVRGAALDKESKAYADTAIPAIVNGWNEKELLDRASPEFKKAATQQQLDQMFRWFGSLGRFQKVEPAQGQAVMSATNQTGKVVSAKYTTKATFDKGEATVTLGLIKHGEQWQILTFDVRSPQLVPK